MAVDVLMPALSPTMTEGNLAKWHKKVGDPVRAGDVLAEIETDKATMEVEAVDEGVMGEIVVPEGTQAIKVNQVIARILEEGEDQAPVEAAKSPSSSASLTQPEAAKAEMTAGAFDAPVALKPDSKTADARQLSHNDSGRIFASPLARRLASEAGINLAKVAGTGPRGRIVKADIDAALKSGGPSRAPSEPATQAQTGRADAYTAIPLTTMRRTIARRLAEVQQTVPVFYLTVDCEIDAMLKARSEVNALSDAKISVNDFVIKAVALALQKVPSVNASWSNDAILRWNAIDVSVAVALDEGLITPIIRNADCKGLARISSEMKDLAARARAGKLKLEEFQGGGFSISNLGMYGVSEFTAVINPPQSCILAVASGEQRAVVKNGALGIATVMSCTISCDHRVVDGATAATFMKAFKQFIEAPVAMLL